MCIVTNIEVVFQRINTPKGIIHYSYFSLDFFDDNLIEYCFNIHFLLTFAIRFSLSFLSLFLKK